MWSRGGAGDARARAVVGRRRGEAGVADQGAGGFVVAMVVRRRCRQDEVRTGLAQGFGDKAARCIVVENREVAQLQTKVARADQRGCIGGFAPAHVRDFLRAELFGTAVAGGKGGDGDLVAEIGQ